MSASRRIVITGSSTGLGAAIARAVSRPGTRLHLCARRLDRLEVTANACRELGADVAIESIDLRDERAGPDWIARIEAEGPIDLLVLNAGIFAGRPDLESMEPLETIPNLITTNLTAQVLCATAAVPAMRDRGAGKIVLISSLAAVSPSPDSPSYSAAKAGVSAFGKALADDLAGTGVSVHLVEPGHIITHHTEQQVGPVPFALSTDAAAARILAGVERGAARIAFPLIPRIYVFVTNLLPRRLRLLLNKSQRFSVHNDPIT